MTKRLISIDDAAKQLGVPMAPLLRAAEKHGFLILLGRCKRLYSDELPELLDKCRNRPKVLDCSLESEEDENLSTSSETGSLSKARAQTTANRLKSISRNTSHGKTAKVVPLNQG